MFNVCDKKLNNIHNINLIHPLKQRDVGAILKELPIIIVFGSATRWDCSEKSDLDLLLDKDKICCSKKEAFKKIAKSIKTDFDLLWLDEIKDNINEQQKKNIIDKGIELYEERV